MADRTPARGGVFFVPCRLSKSVTMTTPQELWEPSRVVRKMAPQASRHPRPPGLGSRGALEIPAEALGSGGPQRASISCWPWIWEPAGALRGHEAKGPEPPSTWGPSGGLQGAPGPFSSRPRLGASRGLKRPLGNPRASAGISRAPRDPSPGGLGCRGGLGGHFPHDPGAIFLTSCPPPLPPPPFSVLGPSGDRKGKGG